MRSFLPLLSRLRFFHGAEKSLLANSIDGKPGEQGEYLAAKFLAKKRFVIEARNVLTPFGEIDIVARRKKRVYFVEVKSLSGKAEEDPRINLTPEKLSHFFRSGLFYARKYDLSCSFSFAAVIVILKPQTIHWYDNLTLDCDAENIIKFGRKNRL